MGTPASTTVSLSEIFDVAAKRVISDGVSAPILITNATPAVQEQLAALGAEAAVEGVALRVIPLTSPQDADDVLLSEVFGEPAAGRTVIVFTTPTDDPVFRSSALLNKMVRFNAAELAADVSATPDAAAPSKKLGR